MKTSPVNSASQMQPSQPVAAQFRGCAPKDSLAQGTSASSSDGFLMCMLKPIGRFFQCIFSFFKYVLCCCSSSSQLPKLTSQLLVKLSGLESFDDSEYVQKSDYCVKIYEEEEALALFEIVSFGKSVGIQVQLLQKEIASEDNLKKIFFGSSACLIKEIPDDRIETAKKNGFIREGDFWVRKGPVEGVISNIEENGARYFIGFLKEDNTFEVVTIKRAGSSSTLDVSGLEMCPGRVKDLVTWVTSMIGGEFTLVVASKSGEINSELKEAGFEAVGSQFILEVNTGK